MYASRNRISPTLIALWAAGLWMLSSSSAHAYVGPGAGFAFVSSFFILFVTFLMAILTLLTWPIRWVFQTIRGRMALSRSRVRRVIILGLDGQDPELTRRFMDQGLLPNFKKLKEEGCFRELGTTLLAESPVAWSSFQTGCNPGRHKIWDFLVPNRKSYLPELSSAQIEPPTRNLAIGPLRIPIGKPTIRIGRRSQPFWKTLGEHGVFSTILRVPITFPPEKFRGVLLSAMCVPDLKGSQGTYYYYSSDSAEHKEMTSGIRIPVEYNDGVVRSYISGPENTMREGAGEIHVPFEVRVGTNGTGPSITINKKRHPLPLHDYTPWIEIDFSLMPGISARGIVRFYLIETEPHFKLFMTPINIDPGKPALPISHPFTYAIYLAKTQGAYATLGVAEDTSALNEEVLDEGAFLKQTWLIHEERERMYFDAIQKTSRGVVACVFDVTDRIQHMFYRHLVEDHPANRGRDNETHKNAIQDLYVRMDDLVGRTMKYVDDDTVFMIMSDHGFKPFKRGVNLNTWLWKNGYLHLKGERTGADMFQDVDFSKTRAYAVGFGGIYLNVKDREAHGIVAPGKEMAALKAEIIANLSGLRDELHNVDAVRKVYDACEAYTGPYVGDAPDLIVGFRLGYRVSWSSVTGGISEEIIEDNTRPWSGDHNFNPPDVPGMLFVNRPIAETNPRIIDVGPTVLDLFGVPIPAYCDGHSFMPASLDGGEVKPATAGKEAAS